MDEVLVCDTNVVIQLAIIYPKCLEERSTGIRLSIHSLVKTESHKLKSDPDKMERLGDILEFILKKVPTDSSVHMPNKRREIESHRRIMKFEQGLPEEMISTPSSHKDRCFLVLARANKTKLATNEKTLFNLGYSFLGEDCTLRTSGILEKLLELEIATKEEVQQGIDKLKEHDERLHADCAKKMRSLGIQYDQYELIRG